MSQSKAREIRIKRIYDPPLPEDGTRILIDRLWPRGIAKEKAAIAEWMQGIAPSAELRRSFCHKPERFTEFSEGYRDELENSLPQLECVQRLRELAAEQTVTLVYAAKDPIHNHAVVLRDWLNRF